MNSSSWNASLMYCDRDFPGATLTGPFNRHNGLSSIPGASITEPMLTFLPSACKLCWIAMTLAVDAIYGMKFVVSQPDRMNAIATIANEIFFVLRIFKFQN